MGEIFLINTQTHTHTPPPPTPPPTPRPTFRPTPILSGQNKGWVEHLLPSGSSLGQRCYRMSSDGASASKFHEKCDGKGPTVTVVKTTTGSVFGAYRDSSFKSNGGYEPSTDSFLFIVKDRMYMKKKLPLYQHKDMALYNHRSYGPCFGGGHDFCIQYQRWGSKGYANMGYTYKAPNGGYPYYPDTSRNSEFTPHEMEIFLINTQTHTHTPPPPTTNAPTTNAPTTNAQTTNAPTTNAPTTNAPT